MTSFEKLPEDRRLTIVKESAARLGVLPVIVEKDYWVCWLLGRIFENPDSMEHIVFKGGTSLSKVFGVIQRFSEDIDLSVSPKILEFDENALDKETAKRTRERLFKDLQAACAKFVQERFHHQLEKDVANRLGPRSENSTWLEYKYDERTQSPILFFHYPASLPMEQGYIAPVVKLEFGSLTDQQPKGTHTITAMMATAIPEITDGGSTVLALEVERTFWEKATILHSEHHRPKEKPIPDRFARHYSDFAALWGHAAKEAALKRLDLLEQVANFKARFFHTSWSNYDSARAGTLKLTPAEGREDELRRDYGKMKPMFLTEPPTFSEIMETLKGAQQNLNGS